MFARAQEKHKAKALPEELVMARRHLKDKGWSYRTAAPKLGVCYQHLASVLTGERKSHRLLIRIRELPERKKL